MTTATDIINPEGLPDETLTHLAEMAGTIYGDIMQSDKYEEMLEDIILRFEDVDPLDTRAFLQIQMKYARQLRRTLILVLMHENQ